MHIEKANTFLCRLAPTVGKASEVLEVVPGNPGDSILIHSFCDVKDEAFEKGSLCLRVDTPRNGQVKYGASHTAQCLSTSKFKDGKREKVQHESHLRVTLLVV